MFDLATVLYNEPGICPSWSFFLSHNWIKKQIYQEIKITTKTFISP
jgi:hypothetical protein